MTMVEFGCNWDPNEEFDDDLLGILDFPMESLEGDELVGDWDISNLQCLGPIPSNVLMGPPTIRNDKIDMGPPRLLPGLVAPVAGATGQQQQLSNNIGASSSHIHQQNKLANFQDSGAFKTQSPVSVLESSGSFLGGKSLSIKSNNTIPVRSRSKRVRPAGVNPWLYASAGFSASRKNLNDQRSNESKKKSFQHPVAMDFMEGSPKKVENPLAARERAQLRNASSHRSVVIKKCLHCESTKTPQWREGPMGPKTLCNACGVRYRSGRLFPEYRPARSPSFVPSKHSYSHKKVIEMRNKAKQPAGIIKITEAPEQKQLSNHVGASTSHIRQPNKFANVRESGAFKTQSPVSVVESRSKRVRSLDVNPLFLASPGLSTFQKTLNTRSIGTLQIAGDTEQQQLSNHVDASTSHIHQWNKSAVFQESGAFETQQPISVLESGGSVLGGKSLSHKHDNTIPVQSRKRVRPTRFNPLLLASPGLSTSQKTLNTRSKESKKKPFQHPITMDFMEVPPIKVEYLLAISDRSHGQNTSSHRTSVNKKCAHCSSTKTPQWREGPTGPLCNACGVRYRTGRLFPEYRPAASPSFLPSKHSNSHRKVIEMRNKAKLLEGETKVTPISPQQIIKTEEPPLSPQPEFVPISSYFFDYIN